MLCAPAVPPVASSIRAAAASLVSGFIRQFPLGPRPFCHHYQRFSRQDARRVAFVAGGHRFAVCQKTRHSGGLMIRRRTALLTAAAIIANSRARAAETIKVGVMFPLTGNSAASGAEAKAAVEVAAAIVNTGHPELKGPTGGTHP